MLDNTKHLSVQSFQRNQSLLEAINNYLIHLKLKDKGLNSKFDISRIEEANRLILSFLKRLNDVISNDVKNAPPTVRMLGLDNRFKSLISQFTEAKGRKRSFKSVLFRQNPALVIKMLEQNASEDKKELIDSLTELGNLIEDHLSTDMKEIIGDI